MRKNLGFLEKKKLKKTAKNDVENEAFEDFVSGKKYSANNTVYGSKKDVIISAFMFTEMNEFAYKRDLYYKKHPFFYRHKIDKNKFSFSCRKFNVALSALEKEVKDNIRQIDISRCKCKVDCKAIEERKRIQNKDDKAPEITALCESQKAESIRKCEAEVSLYKSAALALHDEKIRLIKRMTDDINAMFKRQMLRVNTYYRWANRAMPELPAVCAKGEDLLEMSGIDLLGKLTGMIVKAEKEREDILKL